VLGGYGSRVLINSGALLVCAPAPFMCVMSLRLHCIIDQDQHGRLQVLAKRAGVSVSDLVRHAIVTLIDQAEREGKVELPLRAVS
jgi:hypothetical protein